jgi:hypothetical protein
MEKLQLSDLSDSELSGLLEIFRQLAVDGRSRLFMDLFCITEKEILSRHISTKIENYTADELSHAIGRLTNLVDSVRGQGVPDSAPSLRFVLLALTGIVNEWERREGTATVH